MGGNNIRGNEIPEGIVYDFSVNINPFGTPESIRETVYESGSIASDQDPECRMLRAKLSAGYEIPADNIVCCNGVSEIIYRICAACGFRRVLMSVPSFTIYGNAFENNGIEVEHIYTSPDNDFVLNGEYLDRGDGYDAIFTADPVDPSGAVMSSEELNRISKWCEETDTVLVVDESGMDLVDQTLFEEYESPDAENKVVVIRSFTKTFSISGAGIGFALFSDAEMASAVAGYTLPCRVSGVAQSAAEAALREQEFVERSVRYISKEREYLRDSLRKMGYRCFNGVANYVLFSGEKGLGEELVREGFYVHDCLEHEGLGDIGGRRLYRIAVRIHRENVLLMEAIGRCRSRAARTAGLMILGTMPRAGKSTIASSLCRIFEEDGYSPAIISISDHQGSAGQSYDTAAGAESSVLAVYEGLTADHDIIIIDGGPGPAEYDPDGRNIDEMKIASMTGSPVMLVGDHQKGGIFAQMLGTLKLLDDDERELVKGLIVNNSDISQDKEEGFREALGRLCCCDVLGIVPAVGQADEAFAVTEITGAECQEDTGSGEAQDTEEPDASVELIYDASMNEEMAAPPEMIDGDILAYSWQAEEPGQKRPDYLKKILSRKASAKQRERIRNAEKDLSERMNEIEKQLKAFGRKKVSPITDPESGIADTAAVSSEISAEGSAEVLKNTAEPEAALERQELRIDDELRRALDIESIYRIMGIAVSENAADACNE